MSSILISKYASLWCRRAYDNNTTTVRNGSLILCQTYLLEVRFVVIWEVDQETLNVF